jgi:organic radical activating enzyme
MIYTFACNAACDHCVVESSPKRKQKLDPATAIEILRTGAQYGKSFLDISGGEAMLFPKEIMEVMNAARDLGYYICLNTNAFWARTPADARAVLTDLKAAGLNAVFPSASAYHLRYVPLERVKFAREAVHELGLVYELNYFYSAQPETDAMISSELDLKDEVFFFDGLTTSSNSAEEMDRLKAVYTTRKPEDMDDCLSVHFGVNPHGHAVSSCNMTFTNDKFKNTPFFLGNFKEQSIEEIFRIERDSAVLQYIYKNPHPAMNKLVSGDPVVGEYHNATYADREYYSIIDYYLDLFRDDKIMPRINELLPAPVITG